MDFGIVSALPSVHYSLYHRVTEFEVSTKSTSTVAILNMHRTISPLTPRVLIIVPTVTHEAILSHLVQGSKMSYTARRSYLEPAPNLN